MPTRAELLPVLGPLLEILPRVGLVMAGGLVALLAATWCGRAMRSRRAAGSLGGWLAVVVAVVIARLGVASLAALGRAAVSGATMAEPLSVAGAQPVLRDDAPLVAVSIVAGVVVACVLWILSPRRDASAAAILTGGVEDRAGRIGAAGEALVASELWELGCPVLRNVVLGEAERTVEIDHLVRLPDGILVIETKTSSGLVTGAPDAEFWTQQLSRGRRAAFLNPSLQNLNHVGAVVRFIGDPSVWVRGLVVSAGTARFDEEIAGILVPLDALRRVVGDLVTTDGLRHPALDAAWRRLEREAERSGERRVAHAVRVRRLRGGVGM